MAILDIYLDIDSEYINLIRDIYKVLVILIIFQLLVYYSNAQKNIVNTSLTGFLLNDDFMTLLIFIIIGISSYYLIFDKLISFN
jgi:hypothetical protein